MISFRRAKSLHDFLVRAVVKPLSEETSECTRCGGRSDCEVCKILKKGTKFYSKEKKCYDVQKGKLHCNTLRLVCSYKNHGNINVMGAGYKLTNFWNSL